jgi:hypothetical protein
VTVRWNVVGIAMTAMITGTTACVGTTGNRAPSVDASWTVRVQSTMVRYPWKEKHTSTYFMLVASYQITVYISMGVYV